MTTLNSREPSDSLLGEERAVRVEDHLNDKLQTHSDLENLDYLLDSVSKQQSLLKQQVRLRIRLNTTRTKNRSASRSPINPGQV